MDETSTSKGKYSTVSTLDESQSSRKRKKFEKSYISLLKERAEIHNPERIKKYYRDKKIKSIKSTIVDIICVFILFCIVTAIVSNIVSRIKHDLNKNKKNNSNYFFYNNNQFSNPKNTTTQEEIISTKDIYKNLIHVNFGNEFIDKNFLVVRKNGIRSNNIISHFINNIAWIKYALEYNYIPVIDMVYYENLFSNEKIDDTKDNPWEFFFLQPFGYNLKKINSAKNVFLTDKILEIADKPTADKTFLNNKELIKQYHDIADKYIKPNDIINKEVQKKMKQLFGNKGMENVVCVSLRGYDFINKFDGKKNEIEPQASNLLKKVKDFRKNNDLKLVYLVTDEEDIYKMFKKEFGKKLKLSSMGINNNEKKKNKEINDYNIDDNKNNLISLLILSKCENVFATINSDSVFISIMTNGFKNIEYYDIRYN